MPTRAGKRCTFPGCTNPSAPTRCGKHQTQWNRGLHATTPTKAARQDPVVRAHRSAAVAAHVQRHGWHCTGDDKHGAHDTRDLVADDPLPIALGGDPMQELVVMCRSSNSSKGARLT
jgi:hypothetical protein